MGIFADIVGFQWDDGNRAKILKKHGLSPDECEAVFEDPERQFYPDIRHSGTEKRHLVAGKTRTGKVLFVAFTMRGKRVRIISARPINRREKYLYEKE